MQELEKGDRPVEVTLEEAPGSVQRAMERGTVYRETASDGGYKQGSAPHEQDPRYDQDGSPWTAGME